MPITVEATYEDGVLKPKQPLPLKDQELVELVVRRLTLAADETYGMVGFSGDAVAFGRLLEESESDFLDRA